MHSFRVAKTVGTFSELSQGRRTLVLLVAFAFALQGSYIIGPTGPSPITPSLGIPKFIQAAEGHSSGTPTSLTVTLGSTPSVGDVVMIGLFGNGVTTTTIQTAQLSDNQASGGNAYSAVRAQPVANFISAALWCGPVVSASGTFTVTATLSTNGFVGLFALEYSGQSCNQEKVAGAQTATSPYNCGTVTTVNANDLLLTLLYTPSATGTSTFTAPTGFTIEKSQAVAATGQVASIADNIVAATGTFTPTYSSSQNLANSQCVLVAIMSR